MTLKGNKWLDICVVLSEKIKVAHNTVKLKMVDFTHCALTIEKKHLEAGSYKKCSWN